MSIWNKVGRNVRDMRLFGRSVLMRHFAGRKSTNFQRISLPELGNAYFRNASDDLISFRQVFERRDYDIGESSAFGQRLRARYQAILRNGQLPLIVDAGANIGAASLWFRSQYPEAAIVAIEPEPGNCAVLRRNLAGRKKAIVLEAAVGADPGFVTMEAGLTGMGGRTLRSEVGIEVVTIADAFDVFDDSIPFIVKIDIEGFEKDLFASNIEWLNKPDALFVEPHDWMLAGQGSSLPLQRAVSTQNFDLLLSGENMIYVRF